MRLFHYSFLHRWRWLPPLLLGLVLVVSTVSQAQANDAQHVVVTLRDAADHDLDQIVVTVQAPEGSVLVEGVTDRDGAVRLSFANPTDAIRLTVRGVNATASACVCSRQPQRSRCVWRTTARCCPTPPRWLNQRGYRSRRLQHAGRHRPPLNHVPQ